MHERFRSARRIAAVRTAPPAHWVGDGFLVHGYLQMQPELLRAMDPFLLLDYHAPYVYPPTENLRRGVGPHPHRGFETVTVALEGSVAHHDSTGAGGVIGPGDVQWMTAGGGILHKEYHEAGFARAGGRMHMMQIWVNLPATHKMTAPGYQLLESHAIGIAALPDDGGIVRVVAGSYAGVAGAARTFTPIDLLDARMNRGGRLSFAREEAWNVAILVMNGGLRINDERDAARGDFVIFANAGEAIEAVATAPETHVMVLGGAPIGEPIAPYGPFVMNTRAELQQAMTDFNAGRFGELAD